MKTLKPSSALGQQRLAPVVLFFRLFVFFTQGKTPLSYCLQFVWVAFFALILKTVSMLVIETILIYLIVSQFVCLIEMLSVHGLCF